MGRGEIIDYVTTEQFIPHEARALRMRRRSENQPALGMHVCYNNIENDSNQVIEEMKARNDTLIKHCQQCIAQPCQSINDENIHTPIHTSTVVSEVISKEKATTTVSLASSATTVDLTSSATTVGLASSATTVGLASSATTSTTSSEQVITHEERMRRRFRKCANDGFVFQTFKDPCSQAQFQLLHK